MKFFVLKRKHIVFVVIIFLIVLGGSFLTFFSKKDTKYVYLCPDSKYLVVIDAGHGGIDGGCVGSKTNVYESELNLEYAYILAEQLKNLNISVVLTRSDNNGLYESGAKNLKKSDMKKRKEIIDSYSPDLVVSIHMNSFKIKSCRGAQTFYKEGNTLGKKLSQDVQSQLKSILDNVNAETKSGDYYIVTCTDIPSVLVECGFLSNPEEELLLQEKSYQNKICYAISCGIVKYLNEKDL